MEIIINESLWQEYEEMREMLDKNHTYVPEFKYKEINLREYQYTDSRDSDIEQKEIPHCYYTIQPAHYGMHPEEKEKFIAITLMLEHYKEFLQCHNELYVIEKMNKILDLHKEILHYYLACKSRP